MTERAKQLVIVRGGGDIATGTIHRLYRCGYPVLVLESGYPSAIRRCVAFSEAVYDGTSEVEGITCIKASGYEEALELIEEITDDVYQKTKDAKIREYITQEQDAYKAGKR